MFSSDITWYSAILFKILNGNFLITLSVTKLKLQYCAYEADVEERIIILIHNNHPCILSVTPTSWIMHCYNSTTK